MTMDDHFIDSDEETNFIVEIHNGKTALNNYSFEERMELEDNFRLEFMEVIHDIYEKIREYRNSCPDNILFLDKMELTDLIEFCFSQSNIEKIIYNNNE